jgi:hypothetical protein
MSLVSSLMAMETDLTPRKPSRCLSPRGFSKLRKISCRGSFAADTGLGRKTSAFQPRGRSKESFPFPYGSSRWDVTTSTFILSLERLCHNRNPRAEAVGFQSFRMRVFNVIGNRRLYNTKYIHMLGAPESESLKVTALNLFHPTASPPFQRVGFFILRHSLGERRGLNQQPIFRVLKPETEIVFCRA